MKSFRLVIGLFVVVIASHTKLVAASGPNVLLIVADDLGFSDIAAYGGEIATPNLDRLAAGGMKFTQFYNCGDCEFTRAALYSGVHPRQGKGGSVDHLLRPNLTTMGEVMSKAGYATILSGGWYFGSEPPNRPADRGFEDFYGTPDGYCDYFNPARPAPDFLRAQMRQFTLNENRIFTFPTDFYATDAFSDHAITVIRRLAKARQRFFLNLCYTAPHFPLQARAADIARYRGKYQGGYDRLREQRLERQIKLGLFDAATAKLSPAALDYLYDYEVTPWEKLAPAIREREEARMEVYAAMVDRLDQGIGRVLSALDEAGVAGNTVVIFLSDSGGCATVPMRTEEPNKAYLDYNREIPVGDRRGFEFLGQGWAWAQNAPFRRHQTWTYEGGICTPMIVRWPGVIAAGKTSHTPAHVVDLMPTLVELAGAEYPASVKSGQPIPPMEGQSLLSLLKGRESPPRSLPLAWELFGNRAIREGDWKLVWNADYKMWELYNLAADRAETVNLAGKHPERVAAMTAQWKTWAKQTGAPER